MAPALAHRRAWISQTAHFQQPWGERDVVGKMNSVPSMARLDAGTHIQ